MLFPVLLVLLFFGTLVWKPTVIHGPADYRDERYFVSVMTGSYGEVSSAGGTATTSPRTALRDFWKPGGRIDGDNETRLKEWMSRHGIAPESITFFLTSDLYRDARSKAVEDLGLDAQ